MQRLTWTLAGLSAALMLSTAAFGVELRITHSMTGGTNKDAFDAIVAGFEESHPDIDIKQIVFDDDVYSDTGLITQLQSSEVPDIYFEWPGFPLQRDVEAGYAADLSDAFDADWKGSFLDSVWTDGAGTMINGDPYIVPISLDVTNTIWFNKDMFDEYGLSKPATWDDFVAAVKTLADAGITPIIEGNNELWPLGNWASHIASRVVPADEYAAAFNREASFDTPAFHKALDLLKQLHDVGGFNRDMAGLGADPAMAGFFQGAAAMHPIGSWLVGSANEMADADFNYDEFDTPVIDPSMPNQHSVIGTLTGFVVHAKSAHKAEAVEFLKYFTSPDAQKIWAESGALSPVKGVNEAADLDPHTRALANMLANADSLVPPPDTTYPVPVAEAYYQAAAYVATGEKSPADAIAWLDQTIATMGTE